MKIFDTHAHLDLEQLASNIETILERSRLGIFPENVANIGNFSINGVLLPGISRKSSTKVIEIAKNSDLFHAAVGIHPNSVVEAEATDWEAIVELADHPKVVAIGETGLDRYWNDTPFDLQIDYFVRHLDLAKEKGLPVLIHSRDCDADMISVLQKRTLPIHGIIHAFSSTPETAKSYLEMGLHISFAGSVTYTNKKFAPTWETAKIVPDDRLLIETDAPFMPPHPYRGKISYNEPIMVAFVAVRLAELRGQSVEHIAKTTTENAMRIFKL